MDVIIRNYDKSMEEILVDVDKDSFIFNWQINETEEVKFTVMKTDQNAFGFDLVNYENSVIYEGQEYVIKELNEYAHGKQIYKDVVATHIYYTIQDCYQYGVTTGKKSISALLTHVFSSGNQGFSWEVVSPNHSFLTIEQENFGNGNYLKLINEILADYGAIVIPDNKHLRFYPQGEIGEKINDPIRYRYNTDEVKFDIDTYALKTQIRGSGKKKDDGSNYFSPIIYTSPEATKWGVRIQDPIEDERYTVQGNMLERLKRDLHDYPDISGTVKLKWKAPVKMLDFVPFIYEPLNVNTYIQVVGITEYPMLPNKPPEVVLSNTKKTMTAILANLAKKGLIK